MFELISANKRRSLLLIGVHVLVISALGLGLGALTGSLVVGAIVGIGVAVTSSLVAYRFGDAIVLSASRAHPADPQQYKRLDNVVDGLCMASGLPKPKVFIVDDPAYNALVVGRGPKSATMVLTSGLLEGLNRVELEGVVAHELSRIRSYDIMVSTLAAALFGAPALLGESLLRLRWWNGGRHPRPGDRGDTNNPLAALGYPLVALAALSANVLTGTVGNRYASLADVAGCQMTRYPPGLAAALDKMRAAGTVSHAATAATAHLWIAQAMSGVDEPGRFSSFHRRFDTHPPLAERIALIRDL
jgi:heat shock protein HtpX